MVFLPSAQFRATFPRAANLSPRARGIKAMPFDLPQEVFNSFVEKFVEKINQTLAHREKH
jgi:hypothetical protein